MNKLILGTVQLGLDYGINNEKGKPSLQEAFSLLDQAYDQGIKVLDTAVAYGDAHQRIGEFHQQSGGKIFDVITKFSSLPEQYTSLREYINSIINELHVGELWGCLFHSYSSFVVGKEFITALIELKNNEKIKHLGVSVYTNQEFEAVLNEDHIDLIQFPFNVLDNLSQRGNLIKRAKAKGKILHARSIYLQGLFWKDTQSFPDNLKQLVPYVQTLQQLSTTSKSTIQEIALNYVAENKDIDGLVLGMETKEQLISNLTILNKVVPQEVLVAIDENIHVKENQLLNPANWK